MRGWAAAALQFALPLPSFAHQEALVRGQSILSRVPFMVTLIDPDDGALFQNETSIRCHVHAPFAYPLVLGFRV